MRFHYYGQLPRIEVKDCAAALTLTGIALALWRPQHAPAFWAVFGVGAGAYGSYRWTKTQLALFEDRARWAGALSRGAAE